MTRSQRLAWSLAAALACSWLGSAAWGDEPVRLPASLPALTALVPAGLPRGATVEATVQGSNLTSASAVRLTGTGVLAELVPLPAGARPNSSQLTVKLTAAADAEPGVRELRIVTETGTSNIARLVVGTLPEATELEPNDTPVAALKLESLPLVVNGAISRGEDRDHFRFFAKAGQQIVMDLWAERLHPYVPNQRPGWFEGLLTVREATQLGEAADLLLAAEKSASERAAAAKAAKAAVVPLQTAAKKSAELRAATDRARTASATAAAKSTSELAAAKTAADQVVHDLKRLEEALPGVRERARLAAEKSAVAQPEAQASESAQRELAAAEQAIAEKKKGLAAATEVQNAKQQSADRAAAELATADKRAAEAKAATEEANAKLTAAQTTAQAAADELAAATSLVAQRKEAASQIADQPSRRLAYAHDLDGREDPLLVFTAPKDGQYVVEVRDELYRGRAEFNYRLTLGELPFVTSTFPAGGQRGTTIPVTLEGYGLGSAVTPTIPLAADALPGARKSERATTPLGVSNDFSLEVGEDPEVVEVEPNDVSAPEPLIPIPAVVNGMIERDGDADLFQFAAKKGDRLILEIAARSLGSPLDARLELQDSSGRRLKENDDANSLADSWLDHTFTADGNYVVRVTDATDRGSRRHVYRLKLRAPRPDFTLTVSPDNPRVAAGGTVSLRVIARRRDGFDGEIELSVANPPPGLTISPAVISGPLTEQFLTVTASNDAPLGVSSLSVVGRAKVEDRELVHHAVSSEAIRYVNDWRYVPVNDLILTVIPSAPVTLAWGVPETTLIAGQSTQVPLHITRAAGFQGAVRVVLEGMPPRTSSPPVTIDENATEAQVELRSSSGIPATLSNIVASATITADGRTFIQATPALRLQISPPPK